MLFKEDKVARADAEAIRKGVGFYRWTHDLVEITGKDALEVLQKIYISDISKVAVGRSKYTASLDENGEIIDDVIVMHMADGLYWVSDLYGPRLLPWIEQHKGEADIHAKIITYDWDMYAVQGPDSLKAMNAMLDAPVDDLKRFGICERKLGDIPVYIHRSGFTGENGYEIYSRIRQERGSSRLGAEGSRVRRRPRAADARGLRPFHPDGKGLCTEAGLQAFKPV
ncbi:MAG: hypothetical protein V8Q40_01155 [Anaerosacchariphilus sp.]